MKKFFFFFFICCYTLVYSQQTRIVGGSEINITTAPWQVLLKVNGKNSCGGTIIHSNWVLTAKHCVEGSPTVDVVYGITSLNENMAGKTIRVKRIIKHSSDDLALLELSQSIPNTSSSRIVSFANERDMEYTKAYHSTEYKIFDQKHKCMISGWGATQGNGSMSPKLRAATVGMIKVSASIPAANEIMTSGLTFFSAPPIIEGGCYGDSGGPLVTWINGAPLLVGVVKKGDANCAGSNPIEQATKYVRVARYYDWIRSYVPQPNIVLTSSPRIVCGASTFNYSIMNLPLGARISWEPGNTMTLISGQGAASTTFQTKGNSQGNGQGIVKATIWDITKTYVQSNSDVWCGPPNITDTRIRNHEHGHIIYTDDSAWLRIEYNSKDADQGVTGYDWGGFILNYIEYYDTDRYPNDGVFVRVTDPSASGYVVVRAKNRCGPGGVSTQWFDVINRGYRSAPVANNKEIILSSDETIKSIEVIDVSGRSVHKHTGNTSFDFQNTPLAKGVYILKYTYGNNETKTEKVIKK